MFKIYKTEVKHQLDKKIKIVRSEWDGKYCGSYDEIG